MCCLIPPYVLNPLPDCCAIKHATFEVGGAPLLVYDGVACTRNVLSVIKWTALHARFDIGGLKYACFRQSSVFLIYCVVLYSFYADHILAWMCSPKSVQIWSVVQESDADLLWKELNCFQTVTHRKMNWNVLNTSIRSAHIYWCNTKGRKECWLRSPALQLMAHQCK